MNLFKRLFKAWNKIGLIDQYLMIITILLACATIAVIFVNHDHTEVEVNIDIVMRNTMASIFGYFISTNYISSKHLQQRKNSVKEFIDINEPLNQIENEDMIQNQNELTIENKISEVRDNNTTMPDRNFAKSRVQIHIIGCLCILSIVILIFIRYFNVITEAGEKILPQFRNIIFASTGYLIGSPALESTTDKK